MPDLYPQVREEINTNIFELNQLVRKYEAPQTEAPDRYGLHQRIQQSISRLRDDIHALKMSLNNVEALRALKLSIEDIQNRHGFVDDAKERLLFAEKKFFRAVRENTADPTTDRAPERVTLNEELANAGARDFVETEISRQTALQVQQEEDVDSIHSSVQRVRSNADAITVALVEDDEARQELDSRMDRLVSRMKRANKKIDRLLMETAKGTKLGIIAVLLVILVVLVVLTFVV